MPASRLARLAGSFAPLLHASRSFWVINAVNMLDGAAYFGVLNVLTLYLGTTLHFSDAWKHPAVSFMTATVTASAALLGGVSDRLGVRRTLTLTIVLALAGRLLLGTAPFLPHGAALVWPALFLVGVAGGVIQPAIYAGVKQTTTAATATLGFSLLYALMNGGSLIETYLSPLIRAHFRAARLPTGESLEYAGVVWVTTAITAVYLIVQLVLFPRREGAPVPAPAAAPGTVSRRHALLDPRFQFFIFVLLPVRTLFAHQWMTMPDYMTRCFGQGVADHYEWILSINPLVILFGTPLLAALTRRVHVVDMMIAGTVVSAAATFLLVPAPSVGALVAYQVVFSLGEALWSSRFYEYVADVAPPDQVGVYMGVAQIPWFLAKTTTGLYSGVLLSRFIPEASGGAVQRPGELWLLYGLVGLLSPLGLVLARRWLRAGRIGSRDGDNPATETAPPST